MIDAASTTIYQGQILLCNESTFWQWFYKDLESASKLVHIVSPYLTIKRSGKLSKYFADLVKRRVRVIIHTRHVREHDNDYMRFQAKLAIIVLTSFGVSFNFVSRTHRKVAVIDNQICWAGSLNILSWSNTPEQMNRFECSKTANEFIRELNLRS